MSMSHANCSHPKTPAARSACRKAHAKGGLSAPLTIAPPAPVVIPTTPIVLSSQDHMGRSDAHRICTDMFAEHNLQGWRCVFISARRKAGHCNYQRREIALSLPLMAQRTWDDTHKTIIHEIAHALTPGHQHDHVWAAKDIELGGRGTRCFEHTDETAPYLGTCAAGNVHSKYRAPKHPDAQYRCKCPGTRGTSFKFVRNPNA
jgi:hypothetical protein